MPYHAADYCELRTNGITTPVAFFAREPNPVKWVRSLWAKTKAGDSGVAVGLLLWGFGLVLASLVVCLLPATRAHIPLTVPLSCFGGFLVLCGARVAWQKDHPVASSSLRGIQPVQPVVDIEPTRRPLVYAAGDAMAGVVEAVGDGLDPSPYVMDVPADRVAVIAQALAEHPAWQVRLQVCGSRQNCHLALRRAKQLAEAEPSLEPQPAEASWSWDDL